MSCAPVVERAWDLSVLYPTSAFQQELPLPHDLLAVHPYIEIPPHHVNMSGRIPLRPSMRPVRISKCDMHSRKLLILKNLSNHVFQFNIGADGELPHQIAVLVGMGVTPKIVPQLLIAGVSFDQPVAFDL